MWQKIYYVAYTYTILTKFQNTTKNVFRVPGAFITMGLDHTYHDKTHGKFGSRLAQ